MAKVTYDISNRSTYEVHTAEWHIPDFLLLLESPVREIRAVPTATSSPRFKLHLIGHEKDIIEFSYCPSTTLNYMKGELRLQCLNRNEREKNIKAIHLNLVKGGKWTYLGSLLKRDIIQTPGDFLSSETLKLVMTYEVMKNVTIDPAYENTDDLKKILNIKLKADAVIKSKDRQAYNVHKITLASRSPVLKAHFDHGTTESQSNVVESPFESAVLEEVLYYMYTGRIPRIKKLAKDILAAADYYQMDGLKSLCEEELGEQLSVDNANEMFELATSFQAIMLKRWSLDLTKKLHCCVEESRGREMED